MRVVALKIITTLILFSSVPAKSQSNLDLYLLEGAQNNPGLRAEFNMYMAALEQTNISGTLPDPTVAFAYFIQPVQTKLGPQQFRFSVGQMFPWFGTLEAQRNVAAENARVKYEAFLQAKSQLFYQIKMNYYNLYFMNKAVVVTNENIAILETLERLVKVKYEAGKASLVDHYRIQMEMNELKNQLISLNDNIWLMTVKFNRLLNRSDSSEIITPDTLDLIQLPFSKEELTDSILSYNHQVLQLEQKLKVHEQEEILARKMGTPTMMVGIDYIFIGNSESPMDPAMDGKDAIVFPKVSMTIPIYRSKYNAMVSKVNLQIESTIASVDEKKNILMTLFEAGMRDYEDARRRIVLNQNQTQLAEQSLNILITEYSTSNKNFEEVLRMERKLLSFQLALDKARSDLHAAVAFIEFLMGR